MQPLRIDTLTVYMSHLPVRDVHLLVVAWRERKDRHVSSSKDPVSVCLHHLGGSLEEWINKNGAKPLSLRLHGFVKYLVDSDEALGVHVDAALLQEACRRNTSCRREKQVKYVESHPKGSLMILKDSTFYIIFDITCSDNTHVCPQDFSALQHHLLQLSQEKQNVQTDIY